MPQIAKSKTEIVRIGEKIKIQVTENVCIWLTLKEAEDMARSLHTLASPTPMNDDGLLQAWLHSFNK